MIELVIVYIFNYYLWTVQIGATAQGVGIGQSNNAGYYRVITSIHSFDL